MVVGVRSTENWNRGKLLRTDFIKIALPAAFSQEYPQAWIFALNFSTYGNQSLLDDLFWDNERPSYLKEDQVEEATKPKHLEMADSSLGEVLQL